MPDYVPRLLLRPLPAPTDVQFLLLLRNRVKYTNSGPVRRLTLNGRTMLDPEATQVLSIHGPLDISSGYAPPPSRLVHGFSARVLRDPGRELYDTVLFLPVGGTSNRPWDRRLYPYDRFASKKRKIFMHSVRSFVLSPQPAP